MPSAATANDCVDFNAYQIHSTKDEIGGLPRAVQVTLLRLLEERRCASAVHAASPSTCGSLPPLTVTSSNGSIRVRFAKRRSDRLSVFPIQIPALRERSDDIPGLVWHFVGECRHALGKRIETIADENLLALQQYPWPGNIRQRRNTVERAMILRHRAASQHSRSLHEFLVHDQQHKDLRRPEGPHQERARACALAHPRCGRSG